MSETTVPGSFPTPSSDAPVGASGKAFDARYALSPENDFMKRSFGTTVRFGSMSQNVNMGDRLGFIPKDELFLPHLSWMATRHEDTGKIIAGADFQSMYAGLPNTIDIGAIISDICRCTLADMQGGTPGVPLVGFPHAFFDITIVHTNHLGQAGEVEIDVTRVPIRTWNEFMCELLPLLPSDCVWMLNTNGVLCPLANPGQMQRRTVFVKGAARLLAAGMAVGPTICDLQASRVYLMELVASRIRELTNLVTDKEHGIVLSSLRYAIGCSMGSAFRMAAVAPSGASGIDDITEFGFNTLSNEHERVMKLFRYRCVAVGMNPKVQSHTYNLELKNFINARAATILNCGAMANRAPESRANFKVMLPELDCFNAIITTEVQRWNGIRVNGATLVAYEIPSNLNFLKVNHVGLVDVIATIDIPKHPGKELFEIYRFFNFVSVAGATGLVSIVGARGGNMAFWMTALSRVTAATDPGAAVETKLLNPMNNLDLFIYLCGGSTVSLTFNKSLASNNSNVANTRIIRGHWDEFTKLVSALLVKLGNHIA